MPKFDITKLNVAIDKLLEVTENPRHRFLLQSYSRHRYLEIAGRYEEIFAPDMMSLEPVYHFNQVGNEIVLRGQDQVKSLYRMWAETNQSIFFVESEEVAVADHFIASVATSYQQVSGKGLKQAKLLAHLPSAVSHKLVEKALAAKGFKADDNDVRFAVPVFPVGILDHEWRIDDVLRPISFARGHITRQREIRQSRNRNVVRTANSGFQHSPAPDRHAIGFA